MRTSQVYDQARSEGKHILVGVQPVSLHVHPRFPCRDMGLSA
jgi:hypothetical protein